MHDFLIVEENLRAAMRFFGYATGSGEIASLPGSIAMYSGLDYGVFNIAMMEGRVSDTGLTLEQRLAEIAHYFKSRTPRWSLWVCEDLLDQTVRRRARQVIGDFGLRAISHPPGMLAAGLLPPFTALPRVEIEPVGEAMLQRAFTEITSISFEIPIGIAQAVYTCNSAWQGEYRGFVGLAEGRPVSIVALVRSGGTLGVYSLATHPNWRRQGYGEATMRAAIGKVTHETGVERIVLQSTEAGYSLYKRMGFREVTRFSVYLIK
ncbi:MAG: N-acetyltransferase [Bryobacterales bacterium]|nr:N-acetyltransferase [Bryobacterales bacterium]